MIYLYKKMKNKVLVVFKYHRAWNADIISKFSNYYDVESLYINKLNNKNFTDVINEINNFIKLKNIEIVVFDVDYFKFTNLFLIERINSRKKILITGDDFDQHEMHSITASACDLVISGCPLSVLKYKEKGYEAHWMHFEDGRINKNENQTKEIDVLFFGGLTDDRKIILNYINKEGIKLKNIGHEEGQPGISKEELLKLISKSKIILNLSKTRTTSVNNYSSENVYKFYYQWKGRIVVAGLNGVACVSEYSPHKLLFNDQEVPTFFTKEECVAILKKLLNDPALLKEYTDKFTLKTCSISEDKKIFNKIFDSIEKSNHKKVDLFSIPYWYLRIAAKQIILRNIKLTTLVKTILQYRLIFSVIKRSSFFIKILILLESILNTIWYSIIYTIKQKK
tara:strand:+ start:345 stop:1529 length:1185 start_codon:yes stop_codon:yes gene_type:complete